MTVPLVRTARTRKIQLFEFVMPPNFRVPSHGHAPPHILLMLHGVIREGAGATIETCRTGDVRYSPAGDRHVVHVLDQGARCLVVEATGLPEAGGARRLYLSDGAAAITMAEVRRELYQTEYASPFRAEELVLALFATMERQARGLRDSDVEWFSGLVSRVMYDAASVPTLARLAEEAGKHPNFVARIFRARFGVSLGRFRRRRQLHHTWALLADPAIPLTAVAAQGGFSDQSHMTRVVQLELLDTPQRIRDRLTHASAASMPRGNWFQSHELRPIG